MDNFTILLFLLAFLTVLAIAGLIGVIVLIAKISKLQDVNEHLQRQLVAAKEMLLKEYGETASLRKALRDIKEQKASED